MSQKVFLGFVDIAGQLGDFSEAYKRLGKKTYVVVWNKNDFYPQRKYDLVLNEKYPKILLNPKLWIIRKFFTALFFKPYFYFFMVRAAIKFDVFHFMWYTDKSNVFFLYLIKMLGKKSLITFVGSDVRWVPTWLEELKMRGLDHFDEDIAIKSTLEQKIDLDKTLKYIRLFEKNVSMVISHPEQAQLQLRPYTNFYLPLELKHIKQPTRKNGAITVALGIRDENFKGGRKIHQMLEEYSKREDAVKFELIVLENLTHEKVLEVLAKSHIFIYSPYVGSAGKFGHEAVASGAVALVSYDPSWFTLPPDPPFVPITEATLIEKLDHFLRNQEEREAISKKGIEWAKKWTDIDWITADILDKLENNREPDYYPQYFRQHATFKSKWDSPDSLAVANKWTRYVSNTDWYKKYIKSGNREGLEF